MGEEFSRYKQVENALLPDPPRDFLVPGYSYPAGKVVNFAASYLYAVGSRVNWREVLICPVTGLNNRMRATAHILDMEFGIHPDDAIYISEQVTPFYTFLTSKFPNVTGSEYLGKATEFGKTDHRGLRNEDLTHLTFPDESFDYVISLDCFEHFADFNAAFREAYRILKPGGTMLWTIPFNRDEEQNLIRARVKDDGAIEHLMEPEYHEDPISQAGCLCFTHFGWEMLSEVKVAGFFDAYAMLFWSRQFGYLGGEQILFVARMPSRRVFPPLFARLWSQLAPHHRRCWRPDRRQERQKVHSADPTPSYFPPAACA